MRVHYFQHVPFEGLGCIETWLAAHGIDADSTRFDEAARAACRQGHRPADCSRRSDERKRRAAVRLARRGEVVHPRGDPMRASGSWAFASAHS